MKIYIVIGSTGEYSDWDEWIVSAFKSEDKARALVDNATQEAKRIEVERPGRYASVPKGSNKFDPDMRMDYTGTMYRIEETNLK